MFNLEQEKIIEKMIKVSKEKPLLPEIFVPWNEEPANDNIFMPEKMVSLHGHKLWDTLSDNQKKELGKLEMVQVMYSYAWSETLACIFFNKHLLTLNPTSVEYRFLIREIIEEFRHQEMFGMAIQKLDGKPVEPGFWHKFFGQITIKYLPSSFTFLSVLSIELMADIYAKHIRKDEQVYSVLRKTSELHHIEEGRHIFYTEMWLDKFTKNAGIFKSSLYSILVLLNVQFMKSMYVKESFFKNIGIKDYKMYYKTAKKNYSLNFSQFAMDATVEFVKKINGFNVFTKFLWKKIHQIEI